MQDMDTDITFNGVGTQTERVRLPQVSMNRLRFWFNYSITGTAGAVESTTTPFAKMIDQLQLEVTGIAKPRVLDFRSNELNAVQTCLLDGITQVNTLNDDDTLVWTGGADTFSNTGFFDLPIAISTSQITSAPQLSLTLAPNTFTTDAGTAIDVTGFTCTVRLYYEDEDTGFTEMVEVQRMGSDTRHQVPLPTYPVTRTLIEDSSNNDVKLIVGADSFRSDNPQGLIPDYQQIREEATSATGANYLILEPIVGAAGSNLIVEKNTAGTTNVFLTSLFRNAQGV